MIKDMISLLKDKGKINKDIPIAWVNKKMIKYDKYNKMSMNKFRGNLWTSIRKKRTLSTTKTKIPKSLLYWKKNKTPFVCLTE